MKALLITIAAAALCALAASGAVAVASSAVPASAAIGPPLHVISLHSAFARALRSAGAGSPAGVVPPRGTRTAARAAARAAASCTEPNCDLSYGGGAVQRSPHVYLLLWGPNCAVEFPRVWRPVLPV